MVVMTKLLWIFVGWTTFLWITRLRNVFGDSELSTSRQLWAATIAVGFIVGALSLPILHRAFPTKLHSVAAFLAAITIAWWGMRLITNLAGDESVAFKAVHTVLAVGSVGLGALVLRQRSDLVRIPARDGHASTI